MFANGSVPSACERLVSDRQKKKRAECMMPLTVLSPPPDAAGRMLITLSSQLATQTISGGDVAAASVEPKRPMRTKL
jgi:hypothetical protein